jgi:hypothetical protein
MRMLAGSIIVLAAVTFGSTLLIAETMGSRQLGSSGVLWVATLALVGFGLFLTVREAKEKQNRDQ